MGMEWMRVGTSASRLSAPRLLRAGLLALVLAVVGCGGKSTEQAGGTPSPPTVQVRQTSRLGAILTTPAGKTLYTFSLDTTGASNCTATCIATWVPLALASGQPVAPRGLAGALGSIMRGDGKRQVTYEGKPLYTYVRDAQPGDTAGEGVDAFNGTWRVAGV